METSKAIKDFYGKILGYIWTDPKTGDQRATDFFGRILGFYDSSLDMTRTFNGKILAKGNILASLITTDNIKR